MKKLTIFIFLLLFSAANLATANNLRAYFTYCTFYSPDNGPFVETYLSVVGNTVKYAPTTNGKFQGSVEVTLLFKQGEDIKNFRKYNLLSPELADTTGSFVNFIDQQRIVLEEGDYDFEIQIKDNNSEFIPLKFNQDLKVDFPTDEIRISNIELIESYSKANENSILTKSGYDLVPFVSEFYPETMDHLSFYAEIYNSQNVLGAEGRYLVTYHIERYENEKVLGNFKGFARQSAQSVNVVLNKFDISNLASGNYNLVIEVRNKENELIQTEKLFFQRSNPSVKMTAAEIAALSTANSFVELITDRDTLEEYIRSLYPISSDQEKRFANAQLKESDLEMLQKFFLNFWMSRNDLDPELEWRKYKIEVKKVDRAFSTSVRRGYDTDRGRVYLQYGPPNTRTERPNEPSSYPYEIWHYYRVGNFTNRRFVFYNPDLVTNDYELLHSDVIGEPNDYRWQAKLHKRNSTFENIDQPTSPDHWGGNSDELFNMPR